VILDVEIVLERHGHAGERSRILARREPAVDLRRPRAGLLCEDLQIGGDQRLDARGARQAGFQHLGRRDLAGAHSAADLLGGELPELRHRRPRP
jgi:hypothetical protein